MLLYTLGISAGFPSSPAGAPPPFCFPFSHVFWLCSLLTSLCELVATQDTGKIRKQNRWIKTRARKSGKSLQRQQKESGSLQIFFYKIMQ